MANETPSNEIIDKLATILAAKPPSPAPQTGTPKEVTPPAPEGEGEEEEQSEIVSLVDRLAEMTTLISEKNRKKFDKAIRDLQSIVIEEF